MLFNCPKNKKTCKKRIPIILFKLGTLYYLQEKIELANKHSFKNQKHFLFLFIGNILNQLGNPEYKQNIFNEFLQLHLNSINEGDKKREMDYSYLTQRDASANPPGG